MVVVGDGIRQLLSRMLKCVMWQRNYIIFYVVLGCTPDITSQIRENDGLGKKTKSFPSDYSESKIEG
jgi:hypothetical protein